MATRDLIRDTAEAQRLALFFDHILIWPLDRHNLKFTAADKEEYQSLAAEIDYLSKKEVVVRVGTDGPRFIELKPAADGNSWNPFAALWPENCDLVLPFQILEGLHNPNELDDEETANTIIRNLSGRLRYKDAPVTAHVKTRHLPTSEGPPSTLEVCLKKVPLPPENMPWEDFLQFRNDEENVQRLLALRHWIQKQASSSEPASLIQEELESLLHDYQKYMDLQHKKHGEGIISTVMVASSEALAHLLDLKIGSALKAIFDLRAHSIALTEAEMTAPGREVSYIVKAREFIGK
ncbi:hypothetical protein [Sulfuricaulis sp.]|uniref:hypothetical protein n=1 Tax=Sulfuricaulis sp. TaxID=2003553 RepID=UPI0025D14ABF|nr:hypothetical protein [Sulfuricaulis sp.]